MKSVRTLIATAVVAALALTVVGCSQKNIAAKVNGEVITVEELDQQVAKLKEQYPQMFDGPDGEGRLIDFKQNLLDNLISQRLIRQAAKAEGIKISQADVDAQLEQLRGAYPDEAKFEEAMKSVGMTLETLEEQIREDMMTRKLIESLSADTDIPTNEIQAYYEANKEKFFLQESKRASHILFKADDKSRAEDVLKELNSGGDFAQLAKKYSVDDGTASKGGDLGWPTTPFVPEFQAALDKLSEGQTSGLVQTPHGWHIIRCTEERKAKQQKLTDVQDEIKQSLIQQARADAYKVYLDDLREKAEIEIMIDELKAVGAGSSQPASK